MVNKTQDIEQMASELLRHKKLYYSGQKEIEDEEYDMLESQLKKLSPDHSVLSIVGSSFFNSAPIPHKSRMLSLDKSYDINDLYKFQGDKELLLTFKIDGSSCSLIYENGNFQIAKTRGDGVFGENISETASYIPNIPKKINSDQELEVRGEIYCTNENFTKLVIDMEKRGLDKPTSLRNITAGLLGRKENKDLCKYLTFAAFDLKGKEFNKETDKNLYLKKLKFDLPFSAIVTTKKELDDFSAITFDFMSNGDYQIDGFVATYDLVSIQKSLGETKHHPRYKIAFKFEGEVKETEIKQIDWQISRFGILTPVALLEPVDIKGAIINKVTLHNRQMVELLNLKSGDRIKIIRSGEVIPKIMGVVKSSNNKMIIPKVCEYCATDLKKDEVRLFCDNKECPGRKLEDIIQFVKKINIEDLSEKRIELLINQKLVSSVIDIFKLTKEDLLTLDGFKEKLANKIIKNIENSKTLTIIQFFDALGFTGGSKNKVELILQNFNISSVNDFFDLTEEQLNLIKGFGEKGSKGFLSSLDEKKPTILTLINELGLIVTIPKLIESNLLENINFCITGETSVPRKDLEKIIKSNGGKATSSISKNLDYLICNEESSSSKYVKAQQLGITILKEDEFKQKFNLKY